MLISAKPTSRPRSCEFGLDLTSGLPVNREQSQPLLRSRGLVSPLYAMAAPVRGLRNIAALENRHLGVETKQRARNHASRGSLSWKCAATICLGCHTPFDPVNQSS